MYGELQGVRFHHRCGRDDHWKASTRWLRRYVLQDYPEGEKFMLRFNTEPVPSAWGWPPTGHRLVYIDWRLKEATDRKTDRGGSPSVSEPCGPERT